MTRLVAFLRGINVGNRRIKMDDLRAAFDKMGLKGAQTLIASGNVLFEAEYTNELAARIEQGLEKRFGFPVGTVLRSVDELQALVDTDPFDGRTSGKDMKCCIFLLADPVTGEVDFPRRLEGDFEVVSVTRREIFALALPVSNGRFGPSLDLLGKPFDKLTVITNRNWNTIQRIVEKAAGAS